MRRRPLALLIALSCLFPIGARAASSSIEDVAVRDDGRFDLAPYAGRVVYLDFWASWCEPCKKSLPWLIEMDDKYRDAGLVIVAVNVDRRREDADRFLSRIAPPFRVVYDPQAALARAHALEGMPSSFIYDRDGTLVESRVGFRDRDRDRIEASIRELLETSDPGASE